MVRAGGPLAVVVPGPQGHDAPGRRQGEQEHAHRDQQGNCTMDEDFEGVITGCAQREDEGTWITDDFTRAYISLHELGFAHSVEAWDAQGSLVGGLYGVSLGRMFFGESMFARESNASKTAFICLSRHLESLGFDWIDCQIMNPHLESLGARHQSRSFFLSELEASLEKDTLRGTWYFDRSES